MAIGQSDSEDGGIEHGGILRRYAEAILNPEADVVAARAACIDVLGEGATVQAASIVASFDGINRVADATGIRLDPETAKQGGEQIIRDLGYEELGAARA
jgi:hypothetical protein